MATALSICMKRLKRPDQSLAEFKAEWDQLTEKDKDDLKRWAEEEEAAGA